MNDIVNQIASQGQLQQCSAEFSVLVYLFVFTFIITTTATIFCYLKQLGK